MRGGIEETSASFEARSAPRSYPTMVFDHQGEHASQAAAISSMAAKIRCAPETLRHWVRQAERDQARRAGPTTAEHERIRALEREVRELRQANEILRKASAYVAIA